MKPALKESECKFTIFGSCGHIYCAGCLPVSSAKFCKSCNSKSLDNIDLGALGTDCESCANDEGEADAAAVSLDIARTRSKNHILRTLEQWDRLASNTYLSSSDFNSTT